MEDKYIQAIRYKLQKRVRRVNSAETSQFHACLSHLFQFIDAMPTLASVRDGLLARTALMNVEESVSRIVNGEVLTGETEEESAAIGYVLLKRFVDDSESTSLTSIAFRSGAGTEYSEAFEFACAAFLEPFYEYIDEHIDDQQAILYVLRKYKQHCEWFRRNELHQLATSETRKAEESLAYDLYKYLHDQGIDFTIEPRTASGRPDLLTEQVGEDKVLADAKVFWPSENRGSAYICRGFNQLYTYTRDLNEPFGYLVIFKMCEEDLNLMLPPTEAMFPCLTYNNKSFFFVVVDVCEYKGTASERGKLKAYEITDEQLVQAVTSETADEAESG